MHHMVILVHEHDSFETTRYLLHEIAEVWGEQGFRVSVVHGPGARVDADLAILHVDLTVVPADYVAWVRRYPVVINGHVADISKRRISTNLVSRGDGYDGPVIVKTDWNCGGKKEARLARKERPLRGYARALCGKLSWRWRQRIRTHRYPVFESARRVPRAVWRNPHLVVERFLPERRDGSYCLRMWLFLGDCEHHQVSYSHEPVVKAGSVFRREPAGDVPDELRQMRRELKCDFGKFDYGIVDGRVVLYDVNRTPSQARIPKERQRCHRILAEGIRAYL